MRVPVNMKEYIADFFTYFGCDVQQQDAVLKIGLTPEFSEYFRNPKLRLVFHPDHLENAAELITHGSLRLAPASPDAQSKRRRPE